MNTLESHAPLSRATPWIFFITAIFFWNFVGRVVFSPLMLAIETDLHISHEQAGQFYFAVSVGYSLALLLSGFVAMRVKHRNVIALSGVLMGVNLLLLSASTSYLHLLALGATFGAVGGIYLPSGVAAITSLVEGKDYGKALSIHELAPNASFFVCPLIAEWFLDHGSWRSAVLFIGVVCLLTGVLFARFGRGGISFGAAPKFNAVGAILRRPDFWGLVVFFTMGIAASFAPYSMLPLFLVDERGMAADSALNLQAMSRLPCIFAVFAAGWITDKIGKRVTIAIYMVLAGVSTSLLGVLSGDMLTICVVVQAIISVCFFPAGMALMASLFSNETRSLAVSLIIPFGVLGGQGVAPTALGFMGDQGRFGLGFIIFGACIAAAALLMPLMRRK